jgi:hypothetical protein
MGMSRGTYGEGKGAYTALVKRPEAYNNSEDLEVDGKEIIKVNLKDIG